MTDDDINSITENINNINIDNEMNEEHNIMNDRFNFESEFHYKSGIYGIANKRCKVFDDEDFVYQTLVLPQQILNEILSNPDINNFSDYFDMYLINNDELFYSNEDIYKIALLFDNSYYKQINDYENIYDFISLISYKTNNFIEYYNWESYNDVMSDYLSDIFMGIQITADAIMYLSSFYLIDEYKNKYKTLNKEKKEYIKKLYYNIINNFCVCVIYLILYFESNILTNNNTPDDENKITFC